MRPIIADALEHVYVAKKDEMVELASKHKISYEDAEDIVQEAFLYWWTNLDKLEEHAPKRKPEEIASLVYNSVWMMVMNQIRSETSEFRRKLGQHGGFDGEYGVDDYRYHPEVNLMREETEEYRGQVNKIIEEGIKKLPQASREAVELVYSQGLTQQEAAARLGIKPGTLRERLRKGRNRLAELTMPQIVELESSIDPTYDA